MEFNDVLKNKLIDWHKIFSTPLKAEMLEEVLVRVFTEMGKKDVYWKGNSHSPGMDIKLKDGNSYSVKSATENSNIISFSSSRSTKYSTIEEKVKFYKEVVESTYSHYFLLAKHDLTNTLTYYAYEVPKELLAIEKVTNFKRRGNSIIGRYKDIYSYKIILKNSEQFWVIIHEKEYIKNYELFSLKFNKQKLDNGLTLYTI